jgi:hypothetical protein
MKIRSVSLSAFSTPRALIGFGLGATGVLLVIFAFLALPSTARADAPCTDVEFTETGGEEYGSTYVQMHSVTGCTIYYTVNAVGWPANPTHSSAVYNPSNDPNYEGLGVAFGQTRYYKAFAHKTKFTPHDWDSPNITFYMVDNSGN